MAGQAGTGAAIAVLKQIERIAQNGVWYESKGDRAGRDKVAGYDRLKATVYIDGDPYEINMRVRVEDKTAGGENRFYYFTPEVIQATKETDADLRRIRFRERTMEGTSASGITLSQKPRGVNTQPAQTESINIPETEGLNNGVHLHDGGQRADGAHPGGLVSAVEREAGRDPSGQVEGRSADDGAAQKAAETTETAEARGPPDEKSAASAGVGRFSGELKKSDLEAYLKAGGRKNKAKQKAIDGGFDIILITDEEIGNYISDAVNGKPLPTIAYGRVGQRLADDVRAYSVRRKIQKKRCEYRRGQQPQYLPA